MQFIADLTPTTKIVMHPFVGGDGQAMLALHADTPFGPMDFTGQITGDTIASLKKMIAEGRVRFGPRVKAWMDALRAREGLAGLPMETEDGLSIGAENAGAGASTGQCFGGYCSLPMAMPWWSRVPTWNAIWLRRLPPPPPPYWWRRRFHWNGPNWGWA